MMANAGLMKEFVQLPDGSYALQISIEKSDIQVPTEGQGIRTQTIQTHAAVSVPATTGNAFSSWISCDGYDKIVCHLVNDAATNSLASVEWSNDGVTSTTIDSGVIPGNTTQKKNGVVEVKAAYFRLILANTDAAAHTMSAWAYLKAK